MSFTIKDLQNLTHSKEYSEYKDKYQRYIILWEKIYARRKDLWLTQSKLWELSGVPQNKISQLESWTYWEAWIDYLERLSKALEINIEYLKDDDINRKTFEMFNYFLPKIKLDWPWRFQLIKIPYFIDLDFFQITRQFISNFSYVRYYFWPFDKKMYSYEKLFYWNEKWFKNIKFTYLSQDEQNQINLTLLRIPFNDWEELKKLSYETYPLKNLKATIWWNEWMNKKLVF